MTIPKRIRGWPVALSLAGIFAWILAIYWTLAKTYTITGSLVTASQMNGVCSPSNPYLAGETPQQVFGGDAGAVCASAHEVVTNKGWAWGIGLFLILTAAGVIYRRYHPRQPAG